MSTGCKSSHNSFLDVSHSNGGLRISGWIGQLSCLTIFSTSLSVAAFLRGAGGSMLESTGDETHGSNETILKQPFPVNLLTNKATNSGNCEQYLTGLKARTECKPPSRLTNHLDIRDFPQNFPYCHIIVEFAISINCTACIKNTYVILKHCIKCTPPCASSLVPSDQNNCKI